jgi:hypothetical protein
MSLEEWSQKVSPHLQFIEAGAQMAARHARQLVMRPDFESLAEDELRKTREVLQAALSKVIIAQAAYRETPTEPTHAD